MKRHPSTIAGGAAARAFTLVEVMVASLVLVFGIVSAISAMQSGVRAMDRTRKLALATQVCKQRWSNCG
jgi:type II secretory pathway pseudopilin PulG